MDVEILHNLLDTLSNTYGFTFTTERYPGEVKVTAKRNGKSSTFLWDHWSERGEGIKEIINKIIQETEKKNPRKNASRRMVR